MDTMVGDVRTELKAQVTKAHWALGVSGALSVVFGAVILIWPSISLYALVILFGALAFSRGIVGLVLALGSSVKQDRGWLVLFSLLGIAVGLIVFVWTDMSALALLYVIGAYAIALGIIAIGGAFWLPFDSSDSLLFGLTGFLSIVFGVVMFAAPGDGALVLLALIAAYALIIGAAELTVAIGGKRIMERSVKRAMAPVEPHPAR